MSRSFAEVEESQYLVIRLTFSLQKSCSTFWATRRRSNLWTWMRMATYTQNILSWGGLQEGVFDWPRLSHSVQKLHQHTLKGQRFISTLWLSFQRTNSYSLPALFLEVFSFCLFCLGHNADSHALARPRNAARDRLERQMSKLLILLLDDSNFVDLLHINIPYTFVPRTIPFQKREKQRREFIRLESNRSVCANVIYDDKEPSVNWLNQPCRKVKRGWRRGDRQYLPFSPSRNAYATFNKPWRWRCPCLELECSVAEGREFYWQWNALLEVLRPFVKKLAEFSHVQP